MEMEHEKASDEVVIGETSEYGELLRQIQLMNRLGIPVLVKAGVANTLVMFVKKQS